jgi:pimeloyl-ACP methyl ester carboxylesterase
MFYDAIKQKGFDKIEILVGKSLGTRSIGHLMTNYPELGSVKTVLLTPILNDSRLINAISRNGNETLIVIGDNDPFFDKDILESLKNRGQVKCYIVNGADHGLQIKGDLQKTLIALQGAIQEISFMLK